MLFIVCVVIFEKSHVRFSSDKNAMCTDLLELHVHAIYSEDCNSRKIVCKFE